MGTPSDKSTFGHFKNVYDAFIIYTLPLKRCALTYCYRMIHIEYNDNNEQIIKIYVQLNLP